MGDKQLRCKSSGLERLLLACPIRSQAETGQHAGRTTYSILNLIQSSPGGHGWSPDVSCTAYECNPLQGLTLTFPDGVKAGLEKRQKRFSGQGAQKGGEGSQGIWRHLSTRKSCYIVVVCYLAARIVRAHQTVSFPRTGPYSIANVTHGCSHQTPTDSKWLLSLG